MLDHTGTNRIDYEDVMRALGHFIDEKNLREICLIELKEGMLLRGIRYTAEHGVYEMLSESFLFTNEDLERIVNENDERQRAAELARQQAQAQQQQAQQDQQRGGLFRR
jgi:hypothetical protein